MQPFNLPGMSLFRKKRAVQIEFHVVQNVQAPRKCSSHLAILYVGYHVTSETIEEKGMDGL